MSPKNMVLMLCCALLIVACQANEPVKKQDIITGQEDFIKSCQSESDCVITEFSQPPCGCPTAVNTAYLDEYIAFISEKIKNYVHEEDAPLCAPCLRSYDLDALCVDGRCQTRPRQQ